MKYIDADKLIAEIEKWRDKAKEKYNESTYSMGRCDALAEFRNYIVSLQQVQPEADLEAFDKRVTEIWGRCAAHPDDTIACLHIDTFIDVARHFYELGLNARKEE